MLVVEVICSCHSAMTKKAYETAKIDELLLSPSLSPWASQGTLLLLLSVR